MPKPQNSNKIPFVDFTPPELQEGKEWRIVYYVLNPYTENLERKRIRVKPITSLTARRKHAKLLMKNLYDRLLKGWNPFLEKSKTKELTKFFAATDTFFNQLKVEVRDKNFSEDSYKTYLSRIKNFKKYLIERGDEDIFCYKITDDLIGEYLDYHRYTLKNAARTRDNYLTVLHTVCAWLVKKKYISTNPCESYSKLNNKEKNRSIIPPKYREIIFNHYKTHNINFLVFCMTIYYCLTRRTEQTKIKVSDVNLKNRTLYISAEDSKNNKSAHVTIPQDLVLLLKDHIKNAKPNDYLFSDNNYLPGEKRFKPNKATSNFARMRKKLNLPREIKLYSFKDTGITDLIIAGVPLLSVRDQARHHSIKQTDAYTPRNMKRADHNIETSGVKFIS